MSMHIIVETSVITDIDTRLEVELFHTIKHVKDEIEKLMDITPSHQQLFFSNEKLEDKRTLFDYNIKDNSLIGFKLLVPNFVEVTEAISRLTSFTDCKNSLRLEKTMAALATFKSHAFCRSTIEKLSNTKTTLCDEINRSNKFNLDLVRKNHALDIQYKEESKKNKELNASVETMLTGSGNVSGHNRELLTQLEITKNFNVTLHNDVKKFRDEIEAQKITIEAQKITIEDLKVCIQNLEREIENLKVNNQDLKCEIENLKVNNQGLERRLAQHEEKLEAPERGSESKISDEMKKLMDEIINLKIQEKMDEMFTNTSQNE